MEVFSWKTKSHKCQIEGFVCSSRQVRSLSSQFNWPLWDEVIHSDDFHKGFPLEKALKTCFYPPLFIKGIKKDIKEA